jgi:uncharacterized protein YijF (DUF1287 family)
MMHGAFEPASRRKRRISPALLATGTLVAAGTIALLWYWVFQPIFISPEEFFARQKRFDRVIREVVATGMNTGGPELPPWPPEMSSDRVAMVACAERQVVRTVRHAPQSRNIDYPWGDIPAHLGTSADLVVRCMREASMDLQQMVHHDRKADPKRYPQTLFRNRKVDRNMDHRRVAYLFTFARAFMPQAPVETERLEDAATFAPGDLVFWTEGGREGNPGLVGIVSDRRDASGMPLAFTVLPEEGRAGMHHRLDAWPILGHFSLDVEATMEQFLETYPDAIIAPRPRVAE